MNRRNLVLALTGLAVTPWGLMRTLAAEEKKVEGADRLVLSDAEWQHRLTPEQYDILRREGTEPAGSSPLDHEKRKGDYLCVGCGNLLFTSEMKYDSGTGWPSFFTTVDGALETKTDYARRTWVFG